MSVAVQERRLLLDGEWIETGEWHEVRSPYSGEVVGRVPEAGAEHARQAVDAAASTRCATRCRRTGAPRSS